MEAFSNVDAAVSKKRGKTDSEQDWAQWKKRKGATESAAEKTARGQKAGRALPSFPRLGNHLKTDRSHNAVGRDRDGEEVLTESETPEEEVVTQENAPAPAKEESDATAKVKRAAPAAQPEKPATNYSDKFNPMLQVQNAIARTLAKSNGHASADATKSQSLNSSDWQELEDPLSRNKYWANSRTGETRWDKPPQLAGSATQKAKAKHSWQKGVQDGKVYWICRFTGEVRHEKPT